MTSTSRPATRWSVRRLTTWVAAGLLLVTVLAVYLSWPTAHAVDAPVDRTQALADLDTLITHVDQIHPSKQLDQWHRWAVAERNALAARWPVTVPAREFLWQAQHLLAGLNDSHTRMALYPAWTAYREGGGLGFPARLVSRADGVYLDHNSAVQLGQSDGELRLVAIDDLPTETLLNELASSLSGESAQLRREEAIANFPMLLWYRGKDAKRYQLDLERADGTTTRQLLEATVSATTMASGNTLAATLSWRGSDAWLRIPTLDAQLHPGLSEELDHALTQLQASSAKRLIIDLRGNGGGDAGLAYGLLQQLTDQPFRIGSKHWRYSQGYRNAMLRLGLRQRGLPDHLGLHHLLSLQWFAPINRDYYQADGDWLHGQSRTIEPAGDAWRGELAVLVDRFSYSASVDLAATVQDNHLGCIGGEESGGYASYFGEVAPIRLPNSNAFAQIASSYWLRPSGDASAHGVIPDANCVDIQSSARNQIDEEPRDRE